MHVLCAPRGAPLVAVLSANIVSKRPIMTDDALQQTLHDHLAWWGLRHFTADRDYFLWQRQQLSVDELNQLHLHAERKHVGDRSDEVAFYDLAAQPKILPVLYSQRYEYYEAVATRAVPHLREAKTVLDFGCGVGILTSFYARLFPETNFVGVDRSSASIAVAREKADQLGLHNLRFECVDVEVEPLSGSYDIVVTAHALVQAEQDPGLPSQSWRTFERGHNSSQQRSFEQRTGLAARLDRLCQVLDPSGRMIVNEKTRQLARRVPFQRALANRGLQLIEPPALIRYRTVEEVVDDGPCYVLCREGDATLSWDESPECDEGRPFNPDEVPTTDDSNVPLYENHWPSAQAAWEQLKDRDIIGEMTRQAPDGRQVHAERGSSHERHYLYCANTFDQRQLVIVEEARSAMLDAYYQEILRELP